MSNTQAPKSSTDVHIALDLGSDTLKIAYAFKLEGKEYTGKIVHSSDSLMAIPAVAYYDADAAKWYFAEEVAKQHGKSYITVVKIKRLISMLKNLGDDSAAQAICTSNTKYYKSGEHFPNFYFPMDKKEIAEVDKLSRDFKQLITSERTFMAPGYTPRIVCEMYFKHVAEMVNKRLAELTKKYGVEFKLNVSIVYPPHIGSEFVKELERLVNSGFGCKSTKIVLSMTKALSIYASQRNLMSAGESALIFNVGEEKTFVAKTYIGANKSISIDGVEGHRPPIDLGGNDIDRSVANYLEGSIYDRETMGSPSAGNVGHVYESGLRNKQYLFLQEIKTAKILYGMYDKEDELFKNGVPVNASKALYIRMKLTHDQFAHCIGIKGDGVTAAFDSFAEKLCTYVEKELSNSINRDVTQVFISGGVVETYGLVGVIRNRLKNRVSKDKKIRIKVSTFESDESKPYSSFGDGFDIYEHEDGVYAPAIGCAIAALNNITVKTVTSLTYGTDLYRRGEGFFTPLLDKHQEIPEEGRTAVDKYSVNGDNDIASLLIFSLNLSVKEIKDRKFASEGVQYNSYGELSLTNLINSPPTNRCDDRYSRKMEQLIGFMQRNRDEDSILTFHHHGKRVRLGSVLKNNDRTSFWFYAGIRIDGTGVASPYVYNDTTGNRGVYVYVTDMEVIGGRWQAVSYTTRKVLATEIEIKCKPFTVKIEGRD